MIKQLHSKVEEKARLLVPFMSGQVLHCELPQIFQRLPEIYFLLLAFQSTPDSHIKTLRNLEGLCACFSQKGGE